MSTGKTAQRSPTGAEASADLSGARDAHDPARAVPARESSLARIGRWFASRTAGFVARVYLRKPDAAELVAIKINRPRAVWRAFVNEICYLLRLPVSYRLTSINIEITNACNLACSMCPVNTTMKRPKRMMPYELFQRILSENPGIDFVLPFQWGEPLLHAEFHRMVALARSHGLRVMATTNGTRLESEEDAVRLAGCGLERITFSSDGIGATHTRIRGYSWDRLRENVLRFREVRDRIGSPTRIDVSMVLWDETREDLEAYREAWAGIADRVQTIPLLEGRDGRRRVCRELYRGTISVLSDVSVTTCCVDAEGDLRIGDAGKEPLARIWNGARMRELRRRHRRRDFPPLCASCDEHEDERVSKRFQ